jgi:hypothetical protein
MKKLRASWSLSFLILVGVAAPATSQAQIAVNMSLLKCGQYLAMSPDQSRIYAAWMSGWFNQKIGSTNVNLEAYARNVERQSLVRDQSRRIGHDWPSTGNWKIGQIGACHDDLEKALHPNCPSRRL